MLPVPLSLTYIVVPAPPSVRRYMSPTLPETDPSGDPAPRLKLEAVALPLTVNVPVTEVAPKFAVLVANIAPELLTVKTAVPLLF